MDESFRVSNIDTADLTLTEEEIAALHNDQAPTKKQEEDMVFTTTQEHRILALVAAFLLNVDGLDDKAIRAAYERCQSNLIGDFLSIPQSKKPHPIGGANPHIEPAGRGLSPTDDPRSQHRTSSSSRIQADATTQRQS